MQDDSPKTHFFVMMRMPRWPAFANKAALMPISDRRYFSPQEWPGR
jgi:hypothetical protein